MWNKFNKSNLEYNCVNLQLISLCFPKRKRNNVNKYRWGNSQIWYWVNYPLSSSNRTNNLFWRNEYKLHFNKHRNLKFILVNTFKQLRQKRISHHLIRKYALRKIILTLKLIDFSLKPKDFSVCFVWIVGTC